MQYANFLRTLWTGLLTGLLSFSLNAQTIKVGIYTDLEPESVVVSCASGSYQLLLDGQVTVKLQAGDIRYATLEEGRLRVLDKENDLGSFDRLELRSLSTSSSLEIRPVKPGGESRIYDENLLVLPGPDALRLVNELDMDRYLAGVLETQALPDAGSEYIKAQSVVIRTMAMKEMDRHADEGFSLCDTEHCLAYNGKSTRDPGILEAIVETGPLVLGDFNYRLIHAAYHLNSGGQTQRASALWSGDFPYLQSVVDPYSLHQTSAKWKDTILFAEWKSYLLESGVEAASRVPEEIIYVEQLRRKMHFALDGDTISIFKLQEDWAFPSAFFDMFPDGKNVLIWGKGNGHGVGLSQEGARKMAADGYDFRDILQFYYFDVRLMDYRDLPRSSLPAVMQKP